MYSNSRTCQFAVVRYKIMNGCMCVCVETTMSGILKYARGWCLGRSARRLQCLLYWWLILVNFCVEGQLYIAWVISNTSLSQRRYTYLSFRQAIGSVRMIRRSSIDFNGHHGTRSLHFESLRRWTSATLRTDIAQGHCLSVRQCTADAVASVQSR